MTAWRWKFNGRCKGFRRLLPADLPGGEFVYSEKESLDLRTWSLDRAR
jgi:hypothetical protein